MGEPGEAVTVEVGDQWGVGGHKTVYSHVELLASDQERVIEVPLHDVVLDLGPHG